MKTLRFLLVFSILAGVLSGKICFSQEDDSGIIVYEASDIITDDKGVSLPPEEDFDPESIMPIEITGSRIGDSMTSEVVTLSQERIITYADASMGQGISVFKVDKGGSERQVFNFDRPEQAVGRKLSPGSYKVYPNNPNRDFDIGMITAVISLELADYNQILDGD